MDPFRLQLAAKALKGVSMGDAFGDCFFGDTEQVVSAIQKQELPPAPWYFTDDTIMAIALYRSLEQFGAIEQEYIAQLFLTNYNKDVNRGYGPSMHGFFRQMEEGQHWQAISTNKFEGMGSMGNGGAMRAALIGAYFYDDLDRVIMQATRSCTITHSNGEAICGAIAVAVACALTTRHHLSESLLTRNSFLEQIIQVLPESDTRSGIGKAFAMDGSYRIETLKHALGNGERMLAQDTVPLALWHCAKYFEDFQTCLWKTVSALGDRDTLCAIAGGITIMSAREQSIPERWQADTEAWNTSIFYPKNI